MSKQMSVCITADRQMGRSRGVIDTHAELPLRSEQLIFLFFLNLPSPSKAVHHIILCVFVCSFFSVLAKYLMKRTYLNKTFRKAGNRWLHIYNWTPFWATWLKMATDHQPYKHKNTNLVSFAKIELRFGLVVAETSPQQKPTNHAIFSFFFF